MPFVLVFLYFVPFLFRSCVIKVVKIEDESKIRLTLYEDPASGKKYHNKYQNFWDITYNDISQPSNLYTFLNSGGRKHDHGVIIEWDPDLPNTGMLKKNKKPIESKKSNLESVPIRNPHAYKKQNTQPKPHLSYSRTQNDKNGL